MRVTLSLLAMAAATESQDMDMLHKFEEFVSKFAKEYHSVERMLERLNIFRHNMAKAEEMSAKDSKATYSHLSPFADWSEAEFKARNTLRKPATLTGKMAEDLDTTGLPDSWDWRDHGAVNAIKDQAQCGSCWSFGTVANIEGAKVVQGKGQLYNLAEQELVDCDTNDGGCNGGLPSRAYEWLIDNNVGLVSESDYTYTARDGTCKLSQYQQEVMLKDWTRVSTDEQQIAAALIKYGPLAIGLNAGPMQLYFGGIADPADCDPEEIDHAVTLVGYGTEDGTDYWIVRNSWGESWGESGYWRVVRGVGKCGMNTMVTSAIFTPEEIYV